MENKNAFTVQAEKEFNVPVNRLWDAWLNADDLRAWWHPMGNQLKSATNAPAVGAPVHYDFETSNGEHTFTISGEYKKVEPQKLLEYTWNWELPTEAVGDGAFVLNIAFSEAGSNSKLHVTQSNIANEEAVQPNQDGWDKALDELKHYLETK